MKLFWFKREKIDHEYDHDSEHEPMLGRVRDRCRDRKSKTHLRLMCLLFLIILSGCVSSELSESTPPAGTPSPPLAATETIPTQLPSTSTSTPIPAATNTAEPTPTRNTQLATPHTLLGVDASYVTRVEDKGGIYRNAQGEPTDFFTLMGEYGVDAIRLRLWHAPEEPYAGLEDMLSLARRANTAGMDIFLDFHYSDSWADPGQQTLPSAWAGLTFDQLTEAVHDYSADVVSRMMEQGTPPTMIQVGNEITQGILWPPGRVDGDEYSSPQQWQQLAQLLNSAIAGIRSTGSTAEIMLHIADGGQYENNIGRWFFDQMVEQNVNFDSIGLSYYPMWHGSPEILEFNIQDLQTRYSKPIYIVELSYMWTLDWNDWTHNAAGLEEQRLPDFPASPQGQHDYFAYLIAKSKEWDVAGLFYWGGEWISTALQDENGSHWENQALFDFGGYPLPILDLFSNNVLQYQYKYNTVDEVYYGKNSNHFGSH